MKSCRGAVPVIVLYVVGALALTQFVPNWRLDHLFQKGPETKQLAEAQAALEKAKADAAIALAKLQAEQALAAQKTEEQVRYSQQMATGANLALKNAPKSPEVILASSLLDRAAIGLRNAIGDLPADRQAEIVAIVNGALSAKQAEVDAAKAALAVRDHDLEVETKAKQEALAQIPALEAQVKAKDAAVQATQAVVTAKTQEVVAYANKAAEQEKQNGSLSALLNKLMWVAGGVALLYLFVHVWLPIVSQSYPQNKLLQTLSAAAVNLTTAHISVPPTSTP